MGKLLTKCKGKCIKGKSDTTPYEVTGLSAKDRELIRESWDKVTQENKLTDTGTKCFIQLFQTYPYMQDYFISLKDMNEDQLNKSPVLLGHSTRFMHALGCYVNLMDRGEALAWVVTEMAKYHRVRNVKIQQFEEFNKVFIPFLKSALGPNTKPEVTDAWETFLKLIVSLIETNLKTSEHDQIMTRVISGIEANDVTNDKLFFTDSEILGTFDPNLGSTTTTNSASPQSGESTAVSITSTRAASQTNVGSMSPLHK